jgi:hypothetical protein
MIGLRRKANIDPISKPHFSSGGRHNPLNHRKSLLTNLHPDTSHRTCLGGEKQPPSYAPIVILFIV